MMTVGVVVADIVVDDDVVVVVLPLFVTSHYSHHCVHSSPITLPPTSPHREITSTTPVTPSTTTTTITTTIQLHLYSDISACTLHINPHDSSSESSFNVDNCTPFG